MLKSQQNLRDDFNQRGFEFLMTDLDTALAFTQRASQPTANADVKRRNVTNARKGYETVVRLREKLAFDSHQQRVFDLKLIDVKNALQELGEKF